MQLVFCVSTVLLLTCSSYVVKPVNEHRFLSPNVAAAGHACWHG